MEVPYSSPISTQKYPLLGTSLILIGLSLTGSFFIYQMTDPKKRNIAIELSIALVSSISLGFGTLFLMLAFGLYV